MFFLQVFTDHSSTHAWTDHLLEMLFMLLGAFLLGYLLRYFLKPKDAGMVAGSAKMNAGAAAEWEQKLRDWENKYNVYVNNHETAVADWKLKLQGAEDRALTFSRQRDDVKIQLDKITGEQKGWNGELQQIRLAKTETEQKLNSALTTIEKFEKKVAEEEALIASLREHEHEEVDLKKTIETLQAENEKLKTDVKSVRESVDGKDKRIIELLNKEALAKELQGKLDSNAGELLGLRGKVTDLEGQLGGIAAKDAQITALQNEKSALEQRLGALSEKDAEINKLRGDKTSLEQQLSAASGKDAQIASLQNEKSALEQQLGVLPEKDAEINKLRGEKTSLEQQLSAASGKDTLITNLQNEKSLLEQKLGALSDKDAQITSLQQQVSTSTKEAGDLRSKIAEMEADRHRVAENLNELRQGIDADRDQAKQKIAALEAEIEKLKTEKETVVMKAAAPVTPKGMKADDLQVVEGIGPKVNELLHNAGVHTWRALSNKTPDELRAILHNGGERFRILNPNSWPKQARLLADGKWDEFKTYADYLVAGVEPSEIKKEAESPKQPSKPLPAGIKWNDLKVVEGIGPAIEKLLHDAGIKTFDELAHTKPNRLREILEAGGERFRMHDPETWPKQSKLAHDEKWDALKELQDNLSAGKAH